MKDVRDLKDLTIHDVKPTVKRPALRAGLCHRFGGIRRGSFPLSKRAMCTTQLGCQLENSLSTRGRARILDSGKQLVFLYAPSPLRPPPLPLRRPPETRDDAQQQPARHPPAAPAAPAAARSQTDLGIPRTLRLRRRKTRWRALTRRRAAGQCMCKCHRVHTR